MIYLQISAGRGPTECGVAVQHICDKMLAEGPGATLIRNTSQDYAHSCIIGLDGPDAEDYARSWEGTILWVCDNPLKLRHRVRKNWYVGVRRIELPSQTQIQLKDADLEIETMRASGKGGQHVNKTATKVRITHRPTGIVVVSEEQRSQKQNLETAKKILVQKLRERDEVAFSELDASNWKQHNTLERGNPVRGFYGTDFNERP